MEIKQNNHLFIHILEFKVKNKQHSETVCDTLTIPHDLTTHH